MNLSPTTLSHLLNQFPELLHVKLKSVDPRDQPLTRIRPIPLDLAFAIRAEDPQETYFHIELFAACSPPHGELWDAITWQHSLTKYYRNRTQPLGESIEHPESKLIAESRQIQAELIRILAGRGLTIEHARACAEILVVGTDEQSAEVIQLLNLSWFAIGKLNSLRERIKQDDNPKEISADITSD